MTDPLREGWDCAGCRQACRIFKEPAAAEPVGCKTEPVTPFSFTAQWIRIPEGFP